MLVGERMFDESENSPLSLRNRAYPILLILQHKYNILRSTKKVSCPLVFYIRVQESIFKVSAFSTFLSLSSALPPCMIILIVTI